MFAQSLALFLILSLYQCVRFAALAAFALSPWQSWMLAFVCAWFWVDFIILKWIFLSQGHEITNGCIPQIGQRDRWGIGTLGLIAYLCASPFAAALFHLNGTNLLMSDGPMVGPLEVHEVHAHPNAGVFDLKNGILKTHLLGAVKYRVTSRVTEFYYAVPFVEADWTTAQPVAIWAILGEGDLTASDLNTRHYGYVTRPSSLHYAAFAKAVANSEQRSALTSAPQAVLVRLSANAPGSSNGMGSETFWIGMIYLITGLMLIPFTSRLYRPDVIPSPQVETAKNLNLGEAELSRPVESTSLVNTFRRTPSRTRWFLIHLGIMGFTAFSILKSQSVGLYFTVLIAAVVGEVWLLFRSFPTNRSSNRFGCLVALLPTTLFFGLILVGVAAMQFVETADQSAAVTTNMGELNIPEGTRYIRLEGEQQIIENQAGYFYAPNENSTSTWIVPVVEPGWSPETPVQLWLLTTDRTKEQNLQRPLMFAKLIPQPLGIRAQSALDDAVGYYNLKSAPHAVVVSRTSEPKQKANEAEGFVVLAFLGCLFGWICCACYWPKTSV